MHYPQLIILPFPYYSKNYGSSLEIITDSSPEGTQFVNGFGGIGGLLRYKVDFQAMQFSDEEDFDLEEY